MDDLLQEFIAETRETLEALSGEIVAWEAQPADRTRLDAIFRFVHTVKGSCGFLDLPRLARLSHAAEDVLAAVREGKRTPDTALVNAVLAIVDRIGELVEAIDSGTALDDQGEDLLIAALDEQAAPAAPIVAPTTETPAAAAKVASRSVRLGVDLLDRMMGGMSEMVLARNELARRLRESGADPRVEMALERLSLTVADMRETVSQTRMQKIDALFSALPRMVRDTAARLDKTVALAIDGADVELDREMVEVLRDPLAHIIRNAIDHGIETPAVRRAAGKREAGRLCVAARQSGNQILIEIADDGRGIDVERLVAKHAAVSGRSEAELRALPERARLELIFAPGLSSRDEATDISGRGVGMDVVRSNVEQVSGRVDVASTLGRGTTITIRVPLTLSIISTIIVGSGAHRFALPRQAVEEIVTLANPAIRVDVLGDAEVATIRDERMPMVSLAHALGEGGRPQMLVVLGVAGGRYALAVDAVFDTEELVVKPAAPAVMAAGLYAGQTLPDTGRPMLLLDVAGIAAAHALRFDEPAAAEDEAEAAVDDTIEALLFDDLDGQRRAIALAALDRVEVARAGDVAHSAGRLRLTVGDRTVALLACAAPAPGRDVTVLRLNDGDTDLGYAVAEPLSIVAVPRAFTPAATPGRITGVVVLDGEQVELIDTHWLFAHEHETMPVARPTCLLLPDASGWMQTFLRPLLEAAGHRVATSLEDSDAAAVALALDDAPPPTAAMPVVRLSRSRTGDGIYRYDREAVIAAVARHVEGIAA